MGYELQAIVGPAEVLEAIRTELPEGRFAPLEQGFAILPLTDEFWDELHTSASGSRQDDSPLLTEEIDEILSENSRDSAVALVDSSFEGGAGSQWAAVWENGAQTWGPETTYHGGAGGATPIEDGSINKALRRIGVLRRGKLDEFDSVGLGWNRSTEEWLARTG